jgi:hypothetical protein
MTIIDIKGEEEAAHSVGDESMAPQNTRPFEKTPAFVAELATVTSPETPLESSGVVDVEDKAEPAIPAVVPRSDTTRESLVDDEGGQAGHDVDVEFIGDGDSVDTYDYDEPRYEIAAALIVAQDEQGLKRNKFAIELGLKKNQLKKLQCAEADIALSDLQRIGALIGKELHIEFR